MVRLHICMLLLLMPACARVDMSDAPTVGTYVFRIGPGDRLKITTFGEPTLSGEFAVSTDGLVAFPLIGDLPASNMTLTEFKQDLQTRLGARYVRDPRISVEIINFRPVFILGEVAKPGEFSYSERLTIFALVAKAGGFTYRADKAYVFIRRENEIEEQAIRLNSATAVQPGDTVRIPDRVF